MEDERTGSWMPSKQNVIASYAHCSRLYIPIRRALLWWMTQSFQISLDNPLLMHPSRCNEFWTGWSCSLLSITIPISRLRLKQTNIIAQLCQKSVLRPAGLNSLSGRSHLGDCLYTIRFYCESFAQCNCDPEPLLPVKARERDQTSSTSEEPWAWHMLPALNCKSKISKEGISLF